MKKITPKMRVAFKEVLKQEKNTTTAEKRIGASLGSFRTWLKPGAKMRKSTWERIRPEVEKVISSLNKIEVDNSNELPGLFSLPSACEECERLKKQVYALNEDISTLRGNLNEAKRFIKSII